MNLQWKLKRARFRENANIHKPSATEPATTKAIHGTHVCAHAGNTYEYTVSQNLPMAQAQMPYQTNAAALTNGHFNLRNVSSLTRQINSGI